MIIPNIKFKNLASFLKILSVVVEESRYASGLMRSPGWFMSNHSVHNVGCDIHTSHLILSSFLPAPSPGSPQLLVSVEEASTLFCLMSLVVEEEFWKREKDLSNHEEFFWSENWLQNSPSGLRSFVRKRLLKETFHRGLDPVLYTMSSLSKKISSNKLDYHWYEKGKKINCRLFKGLDQVGLIEVSSSGKFEVETSSEPEVLRLFSTASLDQIIDPEPLPVSQTAEPSKGSPVWDEATELLLSMSEVDESDVLKAVGILKTRYALIVLPQFNME